MKLTKPKQKVFTTGFNNSSIAWTIYKLKRTCFESRLDIFHFLPNQKKVHKMFYRPQSLFFPLIKVCPQFLIKGIFTLKPQKLRTKWPRSGVTFYCLSVQDNILNGDLLDEVVKKHPINKGWSVSGKERPCMISYTKCSKGFYLGTF